MAVGTPTNTTIAAGAPTTGTVMDTSQLNAVLTQLRDFLAQGSVVAHDGLVPAANGVFMYTGANTATLLASSTVGRALIVAADAATARAAVGVGTIGTLNSLGASSFVLAAANRLLGSGGTTAGVEVVVGAGLALASGTLSCTVTGGSGGMADPGANGLLVRTALNTTAARSLANSATVTWTNPDGTAGAPSAAVVQAGLSLGSIGGTVALGSQVAGTLALANGGTGAGAAQAAANNLLTGVVVPNHLGKERVVTASFTLAAGDSGSQIVANGASLVVTVPAATTLATAGTSVFSCDIYAQQAFTVDGPGATNPAVAAGSIVTVRTFNGTIAVVTANTTAAI